MKSFDPGLDWAILANRGCPAADELALGLLHIRALRSLAPERPPILDAEGPAPASERPILVLNCDMDHPDGPDGAARGFSWRAGAGRVEFYGDSRHGLFLSIADFFDALGLWWPEPGKPPVLSHSAHAAASGDLALTRSTQYSDGNDERLCLAVPAALCARWGGRDSIRMGSEILEWASRIGFDAVLVLMDAKVSAFQPSPEQLWDRVRAQMAETAHRIGISLELGGSCMNKVIPRAPFRRHKEWWRMKNGKRIRDVNFCATNPAALAAVAACAIERIRRLPEAEAIHLHGSGKEGDSWCHCPSCRAFSPAEQELLALNAIADALDRTATPGLLALPVDRDETSDPGAIKPRPRVRPRPVQISLEDMAQWKSVLASAAAIGAVRCGRTAPQRPGTGNEA